MLVFSVAIAKQIMLLKWGNENITCHVQGSPKEVDAIFTEYVVELNNSYIFVKKSLNLTQHANMIFTIIDKMAIYLWDDTHDQFETDGIRCQIEWKTFTRTVVCSVWQSCLFVENPIKRKAGHRLAATNLLIKGKHYVILFCVTETFH